MHFALTNKIELAFRWGVMRANSKLKNFFDFVRYYIVWLLYVCEGMNFYFINKYLE
jgi:hypothetical protein